MNLQAVFFLCVLSVVTLAFFGLLAGFMQPIFWAAILAILFNPVNARLLNLLGNRKSVAALLALIIICITVIVPFWFVAAAIVNEASQLYQRIEAGEINPGAWLQWLRATLPRFNEILASMNMDLQDVEAKLSDIAVTASQYIVSLAVIAGQNALRFTIMFFIMLYLLYFLLRDGAQLLAKIVHALPLSDEREQQLVQKFAEVSRATIKGSLVIGLVQGSLGSLMFWVLGIEGAVLWGAIMVVTSLLPVVGTSLVWGPAVLILLANEAYLKAGMLLLFGVLVIGLVDNLLRPMLVGRDTGMPDYLVLLSTFGGITVFGASGFVIGPIIAALFLTLWTMFDAEYGHLDPGVKSEEP